MCLCIYLSANTNAVASTSPGGLYGERACTKQSSIIINAHISSCKRKRMRWGKKTQKNVCARACVRCVNGWNKHTQAHAHAHAHAHAQAHNHKHKHTHNHTTQTRTRAHTRTGTHKHVHTCTCAHRWVSSDRLLFTPVLTKWHTRFNLQTRTCTCTRTCSCSFISTHNTHTNTQTHTTNKTFFYIPGNQRQRQWQAPAAH